MKTLFSKCSEAVKWAICHMSVQIGEQYWVERKHDDQIEVLLSIDGFDVDFKEFFEAYEVATKQRHGEIADDAIHSAGFELQEIVDQLVDNAKIEIHNYLDKHPESLDFRSGMRFDSIQED